jgi:hypothetical protein
METQALAHQAQRMYHALDCAADERALPTRALAGAADNIVTWASYQEKVWPPISQAFVLPCCSPFIA